MLLLWRFHVVQRFGGELGKHAVDAGEYAASFLSKAQNGVLWQTIKNFIKRLVDPSAIQNQLIATILAGLAALALALPKNSHQRRTALQTLIAALVLWATWQACILGVYAFSATDKEALKLGGQQRYSLSMIVYLVGLVAALVCHLLAEAPCPCGKRMLACAAAAILLGIMPGLLIRGSLPCLVQSNQFSTDRAELQELLKKRDVPQGKRYMIYADSFQDVNYTSYIARYLLHSDAVIIINFDSYSQTMMNRLSECDFLLFIDHNAEALAFAKALIQTPACANVTLVE